MATAVEEVKDRLNIEDVIGQYVQLKRAGRNFKGLSPFTNEKTASFIVSPEKQIWHDFSSGRGGNVFSFVMEMEGLDFKGALELLARQSGVDLSKYQTSRDSNRSRENEKLYELIDLAAKFYQTHLTRNKTAWEYVYKTRGFTKSTILTFRLGYAPSSGTALVDFLSKKGFSTSQLRAAGLVTSRGGRLIDMFRTRMMIPLSDATGRIVGFTARTLISDDTGPKYINTPQTVLYDKSRNIFGLHLAKESIRSTKYVVIVEGNLDVIASHQAGIRQVVATAGTAITESQLKGLARLTGDIRLSFDQDSAGLKATERAIPIASKVGVNLQIITIPSGKDPDELIKQNLKAWIGAIEKPQYAVDWLINHYAKNMDLATGQGKREFSDLMLAVIEKLTDLVEQDHYVGKIAELIGVSKEALLAKMKQDYASQKKILRPSKNVSRLIDQQLVERTKLQDHLLALTLLRPELRQYIEPVTAEMLPGEPAKIVLEFLEQNPDYNVSTPDKRLQSVNDYIKILILQYEELYSDLEAIELHYEASRLQAQLIQQYVKIRKQELANQLIASDEAKTSSLLEEARQLDKLLKMNKGAMHD